MEVSTAFKREMIKGNRNFCIKLEFLLPSRNNVPYYVYDEDIVEGGVTIDSACSGSDSFDVGSVIIGQCKIKLKNFDEHFNAIDFRHGQVNVYLGLKGDTKVSPSNGKITCKYRYPNSTEYCTHSYNGEYYTCSGQTMCKEHYNTKDANIQNYYKKGEYFIDDISYNNTQVDILAYDALYKTDIKFYPEGLWTHDYANHGDDELVFSVIDHPERNYVVDVTIPPRPTVVEDDDDEEEVKREQKAENKTIYYELAYRVAWSACKQSGISVDGEYLFDQLYGMWMDLVDLKPKVDSMTCREVLSYMAQMCCRFITVDENSNLKISWYRNDVIPVGTDYDGNIDDEANSLDGNTDTADGGTFTDDPDILHFGSNFSSQVGDLMSVKNLNAVTVENNGYLFDEDGHVYRVTTPTLSEDDFIIKIAKNPFVTDRNVELIGLPFTNAIRGLAIRTFSLETMANPCVELGSKISFFDYKGRKLYSYVTEISFSTDGSMKLACNTKGALASEVDTTRNSSTTTPQEVESIIEEEADPTNENGCVYNRDYMEDEYIQWATNVTDNPELVYEEGGEYTQEYVDNYNKGLTYDRKTIDDKIDEVESYIEQYSGGVTSVNIVSVDQLPSPVAEKTLYLIRGEVIIA